MLETIDLLGARFAKTELGQQEIQTRSLGLTPLARRLLILVNGQKSGQDLAAFAGGAEVEPLLRELLDKGCIEVCPIQIPAKPETPAESAQAGEIDGLPDAATRSAAENEMARNFMINTVNTVFGQHSRLTLIETIARAQGTKGLRQAYRAWAKAMQEDRIGARRLNEFRDKLFKVL